MLFQKKWKSRPLRDTLNGLRWIIHFRKLFLDTVGSSFESHKVKLIWNRWIKIVFEGVGLLNWTMQHDEHWKFATILVDSKQRGKAYQLILSRQAYILSAAATKSVWFVFVQCMCLRICMNAVSYNLITLHSLVFKLKAIVFYRFNAFAFSHSLSTSALVSAERVRVYSFFCFHLNFQKPLNFVHNNS